MYTCVCENVQADNLELNHLTLPLFVATQFEVLAPLQRDLLSVFTFRALHPQHNFFSCFCLLSEDGLGLTAETLLFAVVTSSALRGMSLLAFFVLRHLVSLVYLAFFAKGTSLLRHVNLTREQLCMSLKKIFLHHNFAEQ